MAEVVSEADRFSSVPSIYVDLEKWRQSAANPVVPSEVQSLEQVLRKGTAVAEL
jgi:hypothetical protein